MKASKPSTGLRLRVVEDFDLDWPKVYELLDEFNEYEASVVGRPQGTEREKRARKAWEKPMRRGQIHVILAERNDGELAGFVAGHVRINPWIFEETAGVITVAYIRPRFRGRLFFRLHDALLQWFRDEGADVAQTSVLVNSSAHRFWQHIGYEPYMTNVRRSLVLDEAGEGLEGQDGAAV